MKYLAKELLKLNRKEINELPDIFTLQFDNNKVIESSRNKMIYTNFFWDIFRSYPNTPITEKHHVSYVLKGKALTSKTHNLLFDEIYISVIEAYNLLTPESKEHILGLLYKIVNDIYNDVSDYAEEYVTTIDILDFINMVDNPKIKKIVDGTIDSHRSISNCYEESAKVIMKDPSFDNNNLALAARTKLIDIGQLLQTVTVRGRVTEVDGTILPYGIMGNFTKGLTSLYEIVAESRSAAKSLYYTDIKIGDTEYSSRRLQLLCMVVEKISYTDCGSTDYLEWNVRPPSFDDEGTEVYEGDLRNMLGKYYLDEKSNCLKILSPNDTHLHGKTIKLRSSHKCWDKDPHKVCEICFGALAKNVSKYANIGHLAVITMTERLSQNVLSIKHKDHNATGDSVVLNEMTRKYFSVDATKSSYVFLDKFKDMEVNLIINKEEVYGLTDLNTINDMNIVVPIRFSAIEYLDISYVRKGIRITDFLKVSMRDKPVILSLDFLKYLKIHKWKIDKNNNNFILDLSKWDFSLPILVLPEKEYSFSDHSALISKLIRSSIPNSKKRGTKDYADCLIRELFSLVNSKININLSALEIIVYALTIDDTETNGLSRGNYQGKTGISVNIMGDRSLGTAYTFEGVIKILTNPKSFFKLKRPDSVFDVFIDPYGYVKHNREGK